jgi:hypothetical protein
MIVAQLVTLQEEDVGSFGLHGLTTSRFVRRGGWRRAVR